MAVTIIFRTFAHKFTIMYYIWTDESDATGKYYANFYGGILIKSEHLNEVLERLSAIVKEVGLENEEIKWQKENEFAEERYKKIIDVLFALLSEDKAKQRDLVLGLIPFDEELSKSMISSALYVEGENALKKLSSEEVKELRRIAKEEYDAIPEEEHQRRIAEQHAANRERYEKKMMRKGYK